MRQLPLVFLALAACWTRGAFRGAPPQRAPRALQSVPLLACAPVEPFDELGVLHAPRASVMPILAASAPLSEEGVVEALLSTAAQAGCDALVLRPPLACGATVSGYEVTCIGYRDGGTP